MTAPNDSVKQFLVLSGMLTDFDHLVLLGTGLVDDYYQAVTAIIGETIMSELLTLSTQIDQQFGQDPTQLAAAIRDQILASPKFGPVARNIIQLWYLGSWIQLPTAWREVYGASPNDVDKVVSVAAYQQGLIWPLIGAHTPGAKQPGFGSWRLKPRPYLAPGMEV
jgi:hypothetical protein